MDYNLDVNFISLNFIVSMGWMWPSVAVHELLCRGSMAQHVLYHVVLPVKYVRDRLALFAQRQRGRHLLRNGIRHAVLELDDERLGHRRRQRAPLNRHDIGVELGRTVVRVVDEEVHARVRGQDVLDEGVDAAHHERSLQSGRRLDLPL